MTDNQEAEAADDAAEDADEQQADEESTGLESGDFVRLAYTARATETEQLVDTTDPEVAEEEGVDDQGHTFEPRIIVLGEGHVFPPVEEDIMGSSPGDEGTVVVPAEEAFGEKDPEEVRTVSADKIPEDDRYPGAHVTIDGDHGHIEAIIGGRARVDFNHPLAGEDVEYDYEILDTVEDRVEQAKGLFSAFIEVDTPEMRIETDEVEEEQLVEDDDDEETEADDDEDDEPEYETVTVEKETLYIEATPQLNMNQQWMFSKQQIAQQIIDRLDLDRVIVQEVIDGMGGGPMGGMMGGMGGDVDLEEAIEDADLEDADVDADEIVDELEGE